MQVSLYLCRSEGADVTTKEFSALLDMRQARIDLIKSVLENT